VTKFLRRCSDDRRYTRVVDPAHSVALVYYTFVLAFSLIGALMTVWLLGPEVLANVAQ